MVRSKILYGFILLFLYTNTYCRDVILEFKGAYLLPTNSLFKECYKGSALYGPELTVQLKDGNNWYAFASIDYFQKNGRCLRRCDSTKLQLLPLAVGIKHFFPVSDRVNLYAGLGFQPTYIRTKSSRACVVAKKSQWGFGGIGKVGAYIDITHNFLFDLFIDYSAIRTDNLYGPTVDSCRVIVSAALFGGGLGYRFN